MRETKRVREVRLTNKEIDKKINESTKVEFRFIGTPRCGMNAIARWLFLQVRGFSFYRKTPLDNVSKSLRNYKRLTSQIVKRKENLIARNKGKNVCVGFCWSASEVKPCLKTPSVYEKRINVQVLRDPYNQFASIAQSRHLWNNETLTAREYIDLRSLWINHALSFKPHKNSVLILYNKWATSSKYRQQILNDLSSYLTTDDCYTSDNLTPSAFRKTNYLERDKVMRDSPVITALNKDFYIQKLTQKIFGEI